MTYFAPFIDETGIHVCTYQDILDDQIQQAKNIYGQDIYLGIDSQDYQFISTFALKLNDVQQGLVFAYNSRSPAEAIGTGLDGLIKLNGMKRNPTNPSLMYSTCVATLVGTANTPISNGVVQDISGNKWNLPASVTIGTSGSVNANVTCQNSGPITASPGDISIIVTPAYGWTSVTNAVVATPGVAIEQDSQVKSRQAISTAQPSLTVLEGLKGAIVGVAGVTRSRVYENDTSSVNSLGLPANSVTALVEGGNDTDVARVIFNKKGPGCFTNGTTSVNIADQFGDITPIGLYRPTYVDIDVVLNVHMLSGYTTATTTTIQTAVAAFLNSMTMGVNDIPVNNFFGPALSAQTLTSPVFSVTSITAARHGGTQGTANLTTVFNEALRGNESYITVNAT